MTAYEDVLKVVTHYQKKIIETDNDDLKLLYYVSKLYKLPVSVQHLEETGVGKTVNSLRKHDGELGIAAKTLILKWKAIVAAETPINDIINYTSNSDEC